MPQLKWSELDLLECLEVLPEVAEYETSHRYIVCRDELKLALAIRQCDRLVHLTLTYKADSRLLNFSL